MTFKNYAYKKNNKTNKKKRQRKMGQMLTMIEQSGGRELIHPRVLNIYAVVLFILEIKKKMPFIFCNGGWRYFKASKK